MVKTYAPGFGLIGVLVAIAFQINNMQSAISPLALWCGFWIFSCKLCSVASFLPLLQLRYLARRLCESVLRCWGAQVSVISLKEIGLKGVITVVIVVTFTIFGILGLSKLFKMSGESDFS
jgi:uncharacterized membrane protein YadS